MYSHYENEEVEVKNIVYLLVIVFVLVLSGCATVNYEQKAETSSYYNELFNDEKKDYEPKPEPVMKNKYIRLKTGTIETPDYFSRVYTFMPKEGDEIMVPAKWNDRTGEYEFDKEKFKNFERHYSPEQKANLVIMCYELVLVHRKLEELKLKLKFLKKLEKKGDPV